MVFHWSLSDSKSPQVSGTLLRILAVLSNAVIWIVSTCPPTSKSSRPFNNPLVIVPKAPITIDKIVTFMFHSFFNYYYYYYYYYLRLPIFFPPVGYLSRVSDWQQVSEVFKTLLSVLADLINASMVLILLLISDSASP